MKNHEGKDLAVMFLLVLVLLLLFFFLLSKFGFWSLGKIGWWYHPGQSGRFQRARLGPLGLRPRPLEGLGDLPIFARRISTPYLAPNPICKKSTPRKITTNQKTL
jgi:hypothetical protein